jgi:16S rRNA (adenine1518-N6/adenine1519-N6)-dimethyltransferase
MIPKNPELDQHFLENGKILELEVEKAELSSKDKVVEIGCGDGRLTKKILEKNCYLLGFEIDERFKEKLSKIKNKRFEIFFNDAIKSNWQGANKIVANIPYSLSEPLIHKIISERIELGVVIVGENFKKILEEKKTKIGIIAGLYFDIEFVLKIDKKEFNPIPRVNSWMIKLIRKNVLSKSEEILQGILERKGKLKNAILYALVSEGLTKREAREKIVGLGLSEEVLDNSSKGIGVEVVKRLGKFF